MKKILSTLAIVAFATTAMASNADVTIKRVHREFEAAMMKNDMPAAKKVVLANFAKNFESRSPGGSQDLEHFLKNLVPPGKLTLFHFDLGKVTQKGDTATLSVTVTVKGSAKTPDGKKSIISATEVDKQTWKQIQGAWKMTIMDQVSIKRGK